MRVSVIIPTINEEAVVGQAIASAWQAGAHEVIVADGNSRDGTLAIARDHNAQSVISELGRATQQNAGARVARGEVLLFLHADNRLAPEAIQQALQALQGKRVVSGAFRQRIDASGLRYRLLESGNAGRVRFLGLPYGDQGIFVRRELFDEVGGFPPVPLMEDLLLMKTLRRRGWPVLLPGPLYVDARRWQRQGVVRQTLRNWGLLTAHKLGVSPQRLASRYRRHDA